MSPRSEMFLAWLLTGNHEAFDEWAYPRDFRLPHDDDEVDE